MYQDALHALERKFGQPQAVVTAHLEKLSNHPNLKMDHSEHIINYSITISSIVGVFKSLRYDADLQSTSLLNQAISKLPPNLKEGWSHFTVKKNWLKPTLFDFNMWLQEKAEAHERMQSQSSKGKTDETPALAGKTKTSTRAFVSNQSDNRQMKPSHGSQQKTSNLCIVCRGHHPWWKCGSFNEKTPTQRARPFAEQQLCFSCFGGNHLFRSCPRPRNCEKDGCTSSDNPLLHGAERVFPAKTSKTSPVTTKASCSVSSASEQNTKPTQNNVESTNVASVTDVKRLLQVIRVRIEPDERIEYALALCDSASTHSWLSAKLAEMLKLKGTPVQMNVSGISSQESLSTLAVSVKLKPTDPTSDECSLVEPFLKEDLHVGSDVIDVACLQDKYPHLQPLEPQRYSYAEVEKIIGQDAFHAIRPLEYFVTDSKNAPVAVRLPLGWVLSGPLPSSSSLSSTCFRANVENVLLADQVKRW